MDRKDLIRLYLDAETTCEQEQELAASFATTPPADEEEMAVYKMMQAVKPIELPELPEAGDEYDRILRQSKVRRSYTLGFSLAGIAAAIVAVVLLATKPDTPAIPAQPEDDYTELIQQIAFLSNFNPADAESLEFEPVGDGYVMTAHFPDGQTVSYILTPLDGGFNLISLNQ
ncbi:MAG: hypothetical protein IJK32_01700 [Bacteroidales bacterium]|nr:hypothetical protein [Bacteroidales bacterium]